MCWNLQLRQLFATIHFLTDECILEVAEPKFRNVSVCEHYNKLANKRVTWYRSGAPFVVVAFCKVWSRSRWYWPWGFSSWAAVDSEFSWVNWSESQCRWGSHRVVVFPLSLPEGKLLASRLGCCCPSLRLFRCSLWSLYRLDFANKADYFTAEEMLLLHLYDAPQRHLLKSMHCQNLGKLYNNLIPLLLPELRLCTRVSPVAATVRL